MKKTIIKILSIALAAILSIIFTFFNFVVAIIVILDWNVEEPNDLYYDNVMKFNGALKNIDKTKKQQDINIPGITNVYYHEAKCLYNENCTGEYVEFYLENSILEPYKNTSIIYSYDGNPHTSIVSDNYLSKEDNNLWTWKDNSDNWVFVHSLDDNWYWYEIGF